MECFSTEMHKNFINAVSEDHSVLLSAEQKPRERSRKAVACKTTET